MLKTVHALRYCTLMSYDIFSIPDLLPKRFQTVQGCSVVKSTWKCHTNYPIKRALVNMENDSVIDLEEELTKFFLLGDRAGG